MPLYRYKAISRDGNVEYGELEGPSRDAVISRLQNTGHLPISAGEIVHSSNWLQRLWTGLHRRNRVSRNDVVFLTRELATLLEAGLPLDNALKTLARINTSPQLNKLVLLIQEKVHGGMSFSGALEGHQDIFDRLYLNMIRAGEAGGSLEEVITRIADYMERRQELRSSIITSMLYPVILLVISLLSLFVLMTFVVPQFVPLFEDAGQSLPFLTSTVFGFAEIFRQYWWVFLVTLTITLWITDKMLQQPVNRLKFDLWRLRLPRYGPLTARIEVARLSRTLGTLLVNGVPLLNAVQLVRDVISNTAISELMDSVAKSLEQGQRLVQPMRMSGLIPPLALQLIEVGEESGQLDIMLLKTADIYERDVRTTIQRLLAILEPAIILLLGGLIAVIILSILLALLGLNETIG